MKSFLMLVGVAVVAGAMYVAAASGSQQSKGPSARQFNALKKQVASLSKRLKDVKLEADVAVTVLAACDRHAVPINDFGDVQNATFGYEYEPSPSAPLTLTSALDISSPSDTGAGWFAYGDSTCNATLGGLRHAAARAGVRLPRVSLHSSLLTAHQR